MTESGLKPGTLYIQVTQTFICKMRDNLSISQPTDDTPTLQSYRSPFLLYLNLRWLPFKHREESSMWAPTLNTSGEYPFLWVTFCSDFPEPLNLQLHSHLASCSLIFPPLSVAQQTKQPLFPLIPQSHHDDKPFEYIKPFFEILRVKGMGGDGGGGNASHHRIIPS